MHLHATFGARCALHDRTWSQSPTPQGLATPPKLLRRGEPCPEAEFAPATCPLFVTWSKERSPGAPLPARVTPHPVHRSPRPPTPSPTLAVAAGSEPHLRGCIGTLEPAEIPRGLKEFALTSALRDRRFPPIGHGEVWQLHCGVSLLHSYEHGRAWDDWVPGTHGVIIRFPDPGLSRRSLQATFLPEIAEREGWDHRETIGHLVSKAGWRGEVSEEVLD